MMSEDGEQTLAGQVWKVMGGWGVQWGPGPRQEQISQWGPQHGQKLLGLLPTALHEGLQLLTHVLQSDALKHLGLLLSVLKRGEPLLGALGRVWLPRKSAQSSSHTALRMPLQQHQHGSESCCTPCYIMQPCCLSICSLCLHPV